MSMGIAFASGLFEGMVDAKRRKDEIEIEQIKTEADAQKELRSNLFTMLSSKESQGLVTEEFLRIAGLDGMINLSQSINDVENTISYGTNFTLTKPEKWDEDLRPDNPLRAGGTWLRTFNTYLADPKNRDAFLNTMALDDAARQAFQTDLLRYSDYYVDGYMNLKTNPQTGVVSSYLAPQAAYPILFDTMKNLPGLDAGDNTVQKKIDTDVKDNLLTNANMAVVFRWRSGEGEELLETREFKEKDFASLERIASGLNYGTGQQGVQSMVEAFQDVSRADNTDDAYQVLFAAVRLEQLGASDFNRTAGGPQPTANAIGNYLMDTYGQDRIMMAQAMAPLMVLDEDEFQKGTRRVTQMQPAAHYFEKYLKVDIKQLNEQYDASQETLRQLRQLEALVKKDTTPTGFTAYLKQVFGGAFGDRGQLDQLLGNNTDNTTSQEVLERAKGLGFISTTVIEDLSEIEALKLTLAAQMARAVDPSGRLSNQDFEVQLRRLGQGGFFTGKIESEKKLRTVIDDFEGRLGRMQILHEVANASEFGMREARLLKADRAIQTAMDASSTRMQVPETAAEPNGATQALTLDADLGFYTDGTSYYYDEGGTQKVPANVVSDKINEVYG